MPYPFLGNLKLDKFNRQKSSNRVSAESDSKNLKDVTKLSPTKSGRAFLHLFKPKPVETKARVYALPTRVSTTKLGNSESDSDGVGEEASWEAITFIYNRRYPRAELGPTQDVSNLNDAFIISPASNVSDPRVLNLKAKWLDRLSQLKSAADDPSSCASGQKRPPTDDAKQNKKGKKQRKGGNYNWNPGDGANGGGGGGGGNGKGGGRNNKPDGHRFPVVGDPAPKFDCPFYKHDPDRYQDCKGLSMPRFSDVTQHIERRHLLKDATQDTETTLLPKDIVVHCMCCRMEFFGIGAEDRRGVHLRQSCTIVNIRESGVILPAEYEDIKNALEAGLSPIEKWHKVYEKCFGLPLPPSPHVETDATRRRRAESSLPSVLLASIRAHGIQAQLIARDVLDHVYPGSSPVSRPLPTNDTAQAPAGNPPPPPHQQRHPPVQPQPAPQRFSGATVCPSNSSQASTLAPQSQSQPRFYPQAPDSFGPGFMNPGYYPYQSPGPAMAPPAVVHDYPLAWTLPMMPPAGTNPSMYNPDNNPSPVPLNDASSMFNEALVDPSLIQLIDNIGPSPQPTVSARSGSPSQFFDQNDDFSSGPNFMPPSGSNNSQQRYQ